MGRAKERTAGEVVSLEYGSGSNKTVITEMKGGKLGSDQSNLNGGKTLLFMSCSKR